jgi:hypothetical protein
MREIVRVIHQSGAIEELTGAVKEATIAARDSIREINEKRELKENDVIRDTATAVDEVAMRARETAQILSAISEEAKLAAPAAAAPI